MKQVVRCHHCNAKMVEYAHAFNKQMASALFVMAEQGGTIAFSEFSGRLTFNQQSNFQKIKYWDLVEKVIDEDGSRKGGLWALTHKGFSFLSGMIPIQKRVITYRNEVRSFEGDTIYIQDIHGTLSNQTV